MIGYSPHCFRPASTALGPYFGQDCDWDSGPQGFPQLVTMESVSIAKCSMHYMVYSWLQLHKTRSFQQHHIGLAMADFMIFRHRQRIQKKGLMAWFDYHKLAIYSQKIWQHMATMSENRILLEFDGVNHYLPMWQLHFWVYTIFTHRHIQIDSSQHGYGVQAAVVTGEKSQEAGIPIFFRWVVGGIPPWLHGCGWENHWSSPIGILLVPYFGGSCHVKNGPTR